MTTVKRKISLLLIAIFLYTCFSFAVAPREARASIIDDLNSPNMFDKQKERDGCIATSIAMMLRRRGLIEGNSSWQNATEDAVRKAGDDGSGNMLWTFPYNGIQVGHLSVSNPTADYYINLLKEHPEGIVTWNGGNSGQKHAVLLTDYTDGIFYCADPDGSYPKNRIPLTSSSIIGNGQDGKIKNLNNVWYFPNNKGFPPFIVQNGVLTKFNPDAYGSTDIVIPNNVTSIGKAAFEGCKNLKSITIPNSVTSIGDRAFNCCTSLTSVIIPNSVTKLDHNAFSGCTNLKSVSIPSSVTTIGNNAFMDCTSLTSVKLPDSIQSIGSNAFNNCSSLQSINIPSGLTSISYCMFIYCKSLTSINIPNNITSIDHYAFQGCTGLKSITIPNSVKSMGLGVFKNCSSLSTVTLPNSIDTISSRLFSECTNLNTITLPNNLSTIERNAFEKCISLTSLTIPASVTTLGDNVFMGCSNLRSLNFKGNAPDGGTTLGSGLPGYYVTQYYSGATGFLPKWRGYNAKAVMGSTFPNIKPSSSIVSGQTQIGSYELKKAQVAANTAKAAQNSAIGAFRLSVTDDSKFMCYDINYYNSSTNQPIVKADLPDEGVWVTLPYPSGYNASNATYRVFHYQNGVNKAPVEIKEIKKTAEGVSFKTYSFSPFALYAEKIGSSSDNIIKGDLMRKGKPTLGSFALLGQYLLKTKTLDDYQLKAADMNGDGKVSIADFTLLGKKLLGV